MMNKSALRCMLFTIVTVSSVIVASFFYLSASDPDSVDRLSQSALRQASTSANEVPHIDGPTEADRKPNVAFDQPSQADIAGMRPGDAVPGAAVTNVDDNVWLSQPHNSAYDRFEAIGALGNSSETIAESTLVSLLYDEDSAIRESAVESLASLGTYGAIQGLGLALHDVDPLIRQSALEFLAEIGTRDAFEALTATLDDPDVNLRLAVVYELADAENASASSLLEQFLADTELSVRQVAAEFLED